jgi:hypothetical protein
MYLKRINQNKKNQYNDIKLELVVWLNTTIEGAKNEQVQMGVGFLPYY